MRAPPNCGAVAVLAAQHLQAARRRQAHTGSLKYMDGIRRIPSQRRSRPRTR
jgi:hypothetical protein